MDQAVAFYLRCVAEALWHLEPFRPVYQMYLHRISAEQATALVQELRGLRVELRETLLRAVRAAAAVAISCSSCRRHRKRCGR